MALFLHRKTRSFGVKVLMRTAPLSIHSLFNYGSEYNIEEQNCQLSFPKKQMFF